MYYKDTDAFESPKKMVMSSNMFMVKKIMEYYHGSCICLTMQTIGTLNFNEPLHFYICLGFSLEISLSLIGTFTTIIGLGKKVLEIKTYKTSGRTKTANLKLEQANEIATFLSIFSGFHSNFKILDLKTLN